MYTKNKEKIKIPKILLLNPLHFLSFGFGSGFFPKMPGTIGTMIGVSIYICIPPLSWLPYLLVLIFSFLVGVFLCDYTSKVLGVHDHSAIVLDEIVGYLFTMFMVPNTWFFVLAGFVLFRLFDILKPWPISFIDSRVKGGLGIMLDDVIAAMFSFIIIHIVIYFLPSFG